MEEAMHTALMIILLLASIVLIVSILLQSGNSDGLSGSIAGGAEQLFGKRRLTDQNGIIINVKAQLLVGIYLNLRIQKCERYTCFFSCTYD